VGGKRKSSGKSRARDVIRTQRLLRHVDLEEVLGDIGIEILRRDGANAYAECPDPNHIDRNPSFHVCVEDVSDRDGTSRLGYWDCWSHPVEGFRGRDFSDLVARVRGDVWDRAPTRDERGEALAWIRREYLHRDSTEEVHVAAMIRRDRVIRIEERGELRWPPGKPVADANPEFLKYLERRFIGEERADALGVIAVNNAGSLRRCLGETVPAVLFPIRDGSEVVSWYARSIRRVKSSLKGRYAPRSEIGTRGVFYWTGDPDLHAPVILVEGIFDAERVRAYLELHPGAVPPGNVAAVLGGRLQVPQAARILTHPRVLLLADGDRGGIGLWESVRKQRARRTRCSVYRCPDGGDPGDLPDDLLGEALSLLEVTRDSLTLRVRMRPRLRFAK